LETSAPAVTGQVGVHRLEHARLETNFPHARLWTIEGSSTCLMLDRPDELAAAITSLIAEDVFEEDRS
jgi:pimeloyl-ACP methyl ester carboxylesterase